MFNFKQNVNFNRAVEDFNSYNFNRAIGYCKKVLSLNPKHYEALILMAMCYEAQNNGFEAVNVYKKAISINPKLSKAYIGLFNLFSIDGNLSESLEIITKAVNNCKLSRIQKVDFYFKKAELEYALNQFSKAINSYNKILKYDPKNKIAEHNKFIAYNNLQELKNSPLANKIKHNS